MSGPVGGQAAARPSGSARWRPVHPTVVRLAVRSMFGRRRGLLLLVLPVVLIGLAVLVRALVGDDPDVAATTLNRLGLAVVVPLVALLATTGVLAPEIDDGSISYLLAKPLSRHTIVLSKLSVSAGCVLVFGTVPMVVASFVLRPGDPSLALGFAIGSFVGGVAYCTLFALLSVLNRHAVVIGLLYLLIWEGLVGGLLDGVRWLSLTRWAGVITQLVPDDLTLVEHLSPAYAVIATAVVIVGATWLTGRRLRGFNLTGDE